MLEELLDSVAVGAAGTCVTVSVVELVDVPPGPVQLIPYTLVPGGGATVCVPEVPRPPFHAPCALHDVALLEVHVSSAL